MLALLVPVLALVAVDAPAPVKAAVDNFMLSNLDLRLTLGLGDVGINQARDADDPRSEPPGIACLSALPRSMILPL